MTVILKFSVASPAGFRATTPEVSLVVHQGRLQVECDGDLASHLLGVDLDSLSRLIVHVPAIPKTQHKTAVEFVSHGLLFMGEI